MTERIVELLEGLEGDRFLTASPQPGVVREFETEFGERLPDDIRQVFTRWGGGTLTVPGRTPLGFGPVDILMDTLYDTDYENDLPGMVVVGTTGGGYLYFYDPENRLGRGQWYLYLVSMGDMWLPAAQPVAASATEAVEKLLDGVEFMDAPEIGEDGDIY